MAHAQLSAETLIQNLRKLPSSERQRFFTMLGQSAFGGEDMTHEQVFGHLAEDEFTAQEAAEYLEVSMSTFRRFVGTGKLEPSSTMGRNQLFAVPTLKAFKKALAATKRKTDVD